MGCLTLILKKEIEVVLLLKYLGVPSVENQHLGKFLAGLDGCFGFGKRCHKMRDCLTHSTKGSNAKQACNDGTVPIPPNYGRLYALQAIKDKEALSNEGIDK